MRCPRGSQDQSTSAPSVQSRASDSRSPSADSARTNSRQALPRVAAVRRCAAPTRARSAPSGSRGGAGVEEGEEFGAAAGHEGQPLVHGLPADAQGVGDVGGRGPRGAYVRGEPPGLRPQGPLGPRRQDEQLRVRAVVGGGVRSRRGLLDHHMGVGAAEAEGADARAAERLRAVRGGRRGPRPGGVHDLEGAAVQVEIGVALAEVQAGRDGPVAQRENHLEQSGDARGGLQVADVGLHRADAAARALGSGRRAVPGEPFEGHRSGR